MCAEALAPSERHKFTHNGRVIYEWDQTLTEVNIYVPVPAGVRAKDLAIDIQSTHLKIGIKGNPPYLDVRPLTFLSVAFHASCCTHSRLIGSQQAHCLASLRGLMLCEPGPAD